MHDLQFLMLDRDTDSTAAHLLLQLVTEGILKLKQLKFFVIDECDKVLEKHGECSTSLFHQGKLRSATCKAPPPCWCHP